MTTVPDDVRLARAIGALRDAILLCGGGCLALAVIAGSVIALAGPDATLGPTALTILGGGQFIALVGAVLSALGLRNALSASRPLTEILTRTRTRLRFLVRVVLVWAVGTAAGWTLAIPARIVITLALVAVTAQLAVLLLLAVGRLERAAREH